MPNASEESRILLIEDDLKMCESIRVLLSLQGYDVHTSKSLDIALDALDRWPYDLILLDLNLNGDNGFAIMDFLEERRRNIPVAIITGIQSERKAITALKKGAIEYLKKPFDPDELLQSIKRNLHQHKLALGKKVMDKAIESSRERYRRVVDSQQDYILLLDKKGVIAFVNRSYASYLGMPPKELVGRPLKRHVNPAAHQPFFQTLDAILSGASTMSAEFQIVDQKGCSRWLEWHLTGVYDPLGQLLEIQCIGRDITAKKREMAEIEGKKERFRKLAELTSDWLWEIDDSDLYIYSNPLVLDTLGYRPEEMLGRNLFDLMPDGEARRVRRIYQIIKAERRPLSGIENVNWHKNGSLVTLETSAVPMFDHGGAFRGYRGIARDVTVRKKIEENLSNASTTSGGVVSPTRVHPDAMFSICAGCKMVRDDNGFWVQLEGYLSKHFKIAFSHGICPQCSKELYPELFDPPAGD